MLEVWGILDNKCLVLFQLFVLFVVLFLEAGREGIGNISWSPAEEKRGSLGLFLSTMLPPTPTSTFQVHFKVIF